MERTMLPNDYCGIESNDFPIGKSLANDSHRLLIEIRLPICWNNDRTVDHDKVGISGRQPLAVIEDGARCGERLQTIGLAFHGLQTHKLRLKQLKVIKHLIGIVVNPHI